MSAEAVRIVFNHYPHAGSRRIVLLAIAEHANHKSWTCYPSINRLARLSALSERQVKRCVADLTEDGAIEVARVRGKGNVYRIRIDKLRSLPMLVPDIEPVYDTIDEAFQPVDNPLDSVDKSPETVDNPVQNLWIAGDNERASSDICDTTSAVAAAHEPIEPVNKNSNRAEFETRFEVQAQRRLDDMVAGLVEAMRL